MPRFARELPGTPLLVVTSEDVGPLPTLSPLEESHRATLVHEKRRAEWVLGRIAGKEALARLLARAPEEIAVLPGASGEPTGYLGSMVLPHRLSLSHGHGQAIAWALDRGFPGVDLERVKPRPEGTFRFYLAPEERSALERLEGNRRDTAAVVLWSLKEAVWKTLRPHRGVALLDFALGEVDATAEAGEVTVEPRGAALEAARPLGVTRIAARFVRRADLVYAWAWAGTGSGSA
jgi:4'-phosphopantetheinyl transferase EntD